MYLGLRIGELLALKWKDIDLDNGTIYISKTLIEYENPKYDKTNVDMMKKKGIKRVLFEIQHSTKKSKNRYVPISSKAMELIQLYIADAQYTDPEDFIVV